MAEQALEVVRTLGMNTGGTAGQQLTRIAPSPCGQLWHPQHPGQTANLQWLLTERLAQHIFSFHEIFRASIVTSAGTYLSRENQALF